MIAPKTTKGSGFCNSICTHLSIAANRLRRNLAFSALAFVAIAVGVAISTLGFAVAYALLLRELPYPHAHRLVALRTQIPEWGTTESLINGTLFREWTEAESLDAIGLMDARVGAVRTPGGAIPAAVVSVTPSIIELFGIKITKGRGFFEVDTANGAQPVALVRESWFRQKTASEEIIGARLVVDQTVYTIVGAIPDDFYLPGLENSSLRSAMLGRADILIPIKIGDTERSEAAERFNYYSVARLNGAASIGQTANELTRLARNALDAVGISLDVRAIVIPMQEAVTRELRRPVLLLMTAVGVLVVAACLNVSMLALAKGTRRKSELSVRMALGATSADIRKMLMFESVIIALGGGGTGCLVAHWAVGMVHALTPASALRAVQVCFDGSVGIFAVSVTALAAALSTFLPMLLVARGCDLAVCAGWARTSTVSTKPYQVIIGMQAWLTMVLLTITGLLSYSFYGLLNAQTGISRGSVTWVEVRVPESHVSSVDNWKLFIERLLTELRQQPGVATAAVASELPLRGESWISGVSIPGDTRPTWEWPEGNVRFVSPEFFEALGVPVMEGGSFRALNEMKQVVLSTSMARVLWGERSALQQKIVYEGDIYEVVGVAGDVLAQPDKPPAPIIYMPHWEWPTSRVNLVVAWKGNARLDASTVRAVAAGVDPDVAVGVARNVKELLAEAIAPQRLQVGIMIVFCAAAMGLALLGVYGVTAYAVSQSTREMGVRQAFGASAWQVCWLIIRRGLHPVFFGSLLGALTALASGELIGSFLSGVGPYNLGVVMGAAVVLNVAGLAACWWPARTASRVDPMTALKS